MRGARDDGRTVGPPRGGGSVRFTLEIIAVQPDSLNDRPGRTRGGRALPRLVGGRSGTAVRSRVAILWLSRLYRETISHEAPRRNESVQWRGREGLDPLLLEGLRMRYGGLQ